MGCVMSRSKPGRRRAVHTGMPRWLRPRLPGDQVRDLALAHVTNLDVIQRGGGDECLLWQVVGGVLMWSRIADRLGRGMEEMRAQLELATRLVERYGATGRVAFASHMEYQTAELGVRVMDALAEIVDRDTALEAAEWSEVRVNAMAAVVSVSEARNT